MDWQEWHRQYDDPGSELSRRLEVVQAHVRDALDRAPAGPIPVVSLCAGLVKGRTLFSFVPGGA